ncbi:MAG TPA: MFS transporter [Flavitalea sp.]|nr:MFS transporter [Flavitalea sp.]
MLSLAKRHVTGLRSPLYASAALSLVSLGDAFLYPFLPQYAPALHIPVVWVGVLLSINRFVRILVNPFVNIFFVKYGFRQMTIAAAVVAIISTVGYGLGLGLVSLVFLRILWGIAFAILRMSALAYALEHKNIGLSLGTTKSIQELGPMVALIVGPFLLSLSEELIFYLLALLSLPGLFYALKLPELKFTLSGANRRPYHPCTNDLITFLVTFTVEGILVVTIGLFLARSFPLLPNLSLVTLAGGYLAYRRIALIIFSPAAGILADRIGNDRTLHASVIFTCAGLFLLVIGQTEIALAIIFTFNSVVSSIGPASSASNRKDKLNALATNATWRDIGAATGTLTGGLLLENGFLTEVLIIITFVLVIFLIIKLKKKAD